jgi:hypothetical protein
MNWGTPAAIYTLVNMLVVALGFMALRGKLQRNTISEYAALADASGRRIEILEKEVEDLKVAMIALNKQMVGEQELASVSQHALEAQVAKLQDAERAVMKLNIDLQQDLDMTQKRAWEKIAAAEEEAKQRIVAAEEEARMMIAKAEEFARQVIAKAEEIARGKISRAAARAKKMVKKEVK